MIRRRLQNKYRQSSQRLRQFIVHNLLHADDPPHSLALGLAVGVFVAFTPTMGIQMALAVLAAWLLRCNKVLAAGAVWITNPLTMVPIYSSCYLIGRSILGGDEHGAAWWAQWNNPPQGWWVAVKYYWWLLLDVVEPLWLGCIVVGAVLAYPTYLFVYFGVRAYRLRRWGQLVPPTVTATAPPAADPTADDAT